MNGVTRCLDGLSEKACRGFGVCSLGAAVRNHWTDGLKTRTWAILVIICVV